jgi:hypothetical protein
LIFICLFLLAMVGFACGILAPVPEVIAWSNYPHTSRAVLMTSSSLAHWVSSVI